MSRDYQIDSLNLFDALERKLSMSAMVGNVTVLAAPLHDQTPPPDPEPDPGPFPGDDPPILHS
jgi:hypothetical protein